MVLKPEQDRVRTLLQDTITLLCKNGLTYQSEFDIRALIGITLDKEEVFLVDIKETVKNAKEDESDEDNHLDSTDAPQRKRQKHSRRRKRSHSDVESATSDSVPGTPGNSRVKAEELEDDSNNDAIIIKDEPSYETNNYGNQQQQNADILGNLSQAQLYQTTPESLQSAWDTSQQYAPSSQNHPANTSSSLNNLAASSSMSTPLQQQQASHSGFHSSSNLMLPPPPQLIYQQQPQSSSSGSFVCPDCGHTTRSKMGLRYHMNTHRGIYPYHCPHCGKGQYGTSHLRSHLANAHHLDKLICGLCSDRGVNRQEFPSVVTYARHIEKEHGGAAVTRAGQQAVNRR